MRREECTPVWWERHTLFLNFIFFYILPDPYAKDISIMGLLPQGLWIDVDMGTTQCALPISRHLVEGKEGTSPARNPLEPA